MGRGKKGKQGQKKDEQPPEAEALSLAGLSLSEQPSTSAETAAPAAKPAAPPEPEPAEEEDGLGLGLGGGKKKRPKKKKAAEPAAAPAQGERPSAEPAQPAQGPGQVPAAAAPRAKPSEPQPTAQAPPGFAPGQGPPGAPPGFQPAAAPSAGRGLGRGAPSPWAGAAPGHQRSQPGHQPPQPGYQAPPQGYPGPQPGYPGPQAAQQHPPQQARYPPQAAPPQQRPSPQPSSVSVTPASSQGDTRRSPPESVVCRYRIPDKIIGNRVQARPIRVLSNYLEMTIQPLKIHRYDVAFKPDRPKKMIPKVFTLAKDKLYPKHVMAFDQMKNCYSLQPLPKVTTTERVATTVELVDNNGRTMTFEVSFKATGVVDLGTIMNHMKTGGSTLCPPTEAIQCIDVILRQGTLENYIKAGRQFFRRPAKPIDLGDGLEMWTGLFQSAIFTNRAFINIDVAHKGFPRQQSMIEALSKDFRIDPNRTIDSRSRQAEALAHFIKGLRVMATIGGDSTSGGQKREFICNEVVDPPGQLKFDMTDASGKTKTMTVLEYFTKVKGCRLRYPNLNCMWVGVRDKHIYYPMELLEISPGQALNKQLNENQLATMVREAATPPDERKRKIEEVIHSMNYSRNPYFKQFGLNINESFVEVEAKVLAPPTLDCGSNRPVMPAKGAWQASRLLKPETLSSWVLIAIELDMSQSNGENIISLLQNMGGQLGMAIKEPLDRFYNTPMRSLREVLFKALAKNCFAVIIVPTRGRDYYHRVKQMAEKEVGVLTQCIKEYTATRRMNPQTAKNILLKVNSKMMGINQALDKKSTPACLGGGVMVVGADVTHPSPDQSSVPSIAAVTASIDPRCFFSYNIQLSVQTPKKEVIVEFEDMMVEHLKVYARAAGSLPRKIFVFRDGVSEGQFAQVMNSELQAVHRAYSRMSGDPNKRPEVLFLLVQKRHHTRLFVKDPRNAHYNVEPGTVVDKEIVHPRELDFYLVSHQAIKGTARPTRYHAVCNDGKIPHDEVEQLTYYLCHLYSRCMRSVSYPTPTYYAHLACLRARSLTYGQRFDNKELERSPQRLNVLDKMLQCSRMFFV